MKSFTERQRHRALERERLRADMLQHERDLFALKLKELDAQQKTAIVMIRELRNEVAKMGKMIVQLILDSEPPPPQHHAEAIVRDFVVNQPSQGGKKRGLR